jgi:hypothetical protein
MNLHKSHDFSLGVIIYSSSPRAVSTDRPPKIPASPEVPLDVNVALLNLAVPRFLDPAHSYLDILVTPFARFLSPSFCLDYASLQYYTIPADISSNQRRSQSAPTSTDATADSQQSQRRRTYYPFVTPKTCTICLACYRTTLAACI